MAKKAAGSETLVIQLPKLQIKRMVVTLVGDSSLISHAWSDKAKKQISDKQQKKGQQKKEARNPEAEFRASMYGPDEAGKYFFPVCAFKAAAVDACSHVEGITKVISRGAFHIDGEKVEIKSDPPIMREDMVRIGMGVADIRYRGEFQNWSVNLTIRYNANVISPEQIMNLFNTAGFAIGVGEWRPQRKGSMGMFHVASQTEVEPEADAA